MSRPLSKRKVGAVSVAGNSDGEGTMVCTTPRAIRLGLIAAFLAAALTGCAVGERAETLYLYQHRLLVALTTALVGIEPHDPELADRLYDSEDELNTVCRALWQAGSRRIEAQEIDDGLRWQVFTSLDACAERTREVETLLWETDPETAQRYLGDGNDS